MAKSNALAAIRTRAKSLRAKNKNLGWIAAIKKASKELKSEGKVGAAKKAPKQRGKSNLKRDKERTAKAPGKRTVKHGKKKTTVYYETRKNRTDKPGSLTGIRSQVKDKLSKALLDYELATTVKATKEAQKRKIKYRKILKSL